MTHTEQNTTNVVTILCFISFYFAIVHCLIVLPCVCHVVQLLLPEVVSLRSLFTFNHCVVRCMYVFACADLQAIHSQPAMDTMYWRYDATLSHIVASIVGFFFVLLLNYNLDITMPLIVLVLCAECRCSLYGHMDTAIYVTRNAMCDEFGRTIHWQSVGPELARLLDGAMAVPPPVRQFLHVARGTAMKGLLNMLFRLMDIKKYGMVENIDSMIYLHFCLRFQGFLRPTEEAFRTAKNARIDATADTLLVYGIGVTDNGIQISSLSWQLQLTCCMYGYCDSTLRWKPSVVHKHMSRKHQIACDITCFNLFLSQC